MTDVQKWVPRQTEYAPVYQNWQSSIRMEPHLEALQLGLLLEATLLHKVKARSRLALHPLQQSVPHQRIIEAAAAQLIQSASPVRHSIAWVQ